MIIILNMKTFVVLSLLLVAAISVDISMYRNHIHNPNVGSVVITPKVKIPLADLPANLNWGNKDGKNFLTIQRNQHIPIYCGACWAFSAASALSDRIKIRRNAAWPDVIISPQVLISCEEPDQGCHGGDAGSANEWIYKNNITDESCSPYQAFGHDNGVGCSSTIKCKNCLPGKGCWAQENAKIYGIEEYGEVNGE